MLTVEQTFEIKIFTGIIEEAGAQCLLSDYGEIAVLCSEISAIHLTFVKLVL